MSSHGFLTSERVKFTEIVSFREDQEQLRNYLLKVGLLGDFGGVCDSCGEGNVSLTKDSGDSWFWHCGKRSCRKKIGLRKGSFFEGSKLFKRRSL